MENAIDIERIRTVLQFARGQINRQQPDMAIGSLRTIKDQIDSYPFTPEWAEYPLLLGGAFVAKNSDAAAAFLLDAEARIGQVPNPPADLERRVHERLGFYSKRGVVGELQRGNTTNCPKRRPSSSA